MLCSGLQLIARLSYSRFMPTVLIIDDNPAVRIALEVLLSLQDIHCVAADSPAQGLLMLQQTRIDLVLQDMNFRLDTTSGEEGLALFTEIRQRYPDLPVILLTAWTHVDAAVTLMKAGAADYLAKPWDDQKLIQTIRNLLELSQVNRHLRQQAVRAQTAKTALERDFDLCGLIWRDTATEQVLRVACQVARADVPVLITGPNGAGKERIAQIIQANSRVSQGPFVVLNCGAIPAELIEAELFGADAGAYTGANKAREGKFEAADGGTLFLDEIGNLPLSGQMKLLRVLETGRFERLGSNKERQVKVRIISATNADIAAMIKAGGFRQDLYYRLNVIEINLPALAERPADILPLAMHFLDSEKTLHPDTCEALQNYEWPGNVRELKNVMQRASLLAQTLQIMPPDLGIPLKPQPSVVAEAELDKASLERALQAAHGVVAQAAAELGISRQALYRRMDKLGIAR